jgi:ribonuclease E
MNIKIPIILKRSITMTTEKRPQDTPKQDAPKQNTPEQDAPKQNTPEQDAPKPAAEQGVFPTPGEDYPTQEEAQEINPVVEPAAAPATKQEK